MLTRVLTGLVGIPIAVMILIWGTPVIDLVGIVIGMVGIYEFYRVVGKKYKPMRQEGYAAVFIYLIMLEESYNHFIWFCIIFLMTLLIHMVFSYPKYSIVDVALTFVGPLYVGVLVGFILLLRKMPMGEFYVWFVFISSWGSDTFAYFAGRFFGKRKLAPVLSPKKTVEGAIGGLFGAAVSTIIFIMIYNYYVPEIQFDHTGLLVGVTVVAAALSIIGDLTASAIKRFFEEKDYGLIFPGHGGVLDRFDSVLFVAPFLYMVFNTIQMN